MRGIAMIKEVADKLAGEKAARDAARAAEALAQAAGTMRQEAKKAAEAKAKEEAKLTVEAKKAEEAKNPPPAPAPAAPAPGPVLATSQKAVTPVTGKPAVPEYYRPKEMWPAESQQRFAALKAKS